MTPLSIQVPFPVFQDRDGQPLDNGYVWIGEPNLNPQTNPVVAYFDADLTIPAAQPLRTINGYVSRAGTPAQIYVDGVNFSILVQDSKGLMVYNFPSGTGISPDACGVTYNPPFTGAVPTPVCVKLAETVSVKDFGVPSGNASVDTSGIQQALNNSRNVTFADPTEAICLVDNPIMLRNATHIQGNGQQATRIGDDLTFYSGVKKTNNSTVVITNPERPTQTIDCLFYTNGEWEDGKFPQNFKITDMAIKSDSPSSTSVGIYQIQGSGLQLESIDILDFAYAFDCYEFWSSTFKKVRTNGKMAFRNGTSVHLDQCSSGGVANGGLTGGGFIFDRFRYTTLTSCTSDGTNGSAFEFDNSYSIEMDACACEFVNSPDDNTGKMINFKTGNQVNVNGFYGVDNADATKANFSFFQNNTIRFYGGKTGVLAESTNNFDVVITGNANYIEFHQFQFNNFSYNNPKIRFEPGVVGSFVVVYGKQANVLPRVYYTDGTGATLVRNGIIDSGSNSNGFWIKFDDGTLEQYHILDKSFFLAATSTFTAVQGINWYRSNVKQWLFPIPFVNSNFNLNIQPVNGTTGTRLLWNRYTTVGATNAISGQIQLLGVEDFISGGTAYENLTHVMVSATGRWK
jgi:hypothetical protein